MYRVFFCSRLKNRSSSGSDVLPLACSLSLSLSHSLTHSCRMKPKLILIIKKICHQILDNISLRLRHTFNTVSVSMLIPYKTNLFSFVRSFVRLHLSSFCALHICIIIHQTRFSDDDDDEYKIHVCKNLELLSSVQIIQTSEKKKERRGRERD